MAPFWYFERLQPNLFFLPMTLGPPCAAFFFFAGVAPFMQVSTEHDEGATLSIDERTNVVQEKVQADYWVDFEGREKNNANKQCYKLTS